MRAVLVVPLVLLLDACGAGERRVAAPPAQRDRRAELSAQWNPGLTKLNPPPAAWMFGCYAVTPPLTNVLQLTGEVHSQADGIIRRDYRVRLVRENVSPDFWSWRPEGDEVHVYTGNGFYGWNFILRRTEHGLAGEARAWDDVIDGKPRPVGPAEFRRVPC